MHRTWKPVAGGILSIVAGALSVAAGLTLLFVGGMLTGVLAAVGMPNILSFIPFPILGVVATPLFLLGATAIIGGAASVRRKTWPLALAGAICALFPPKLTILGILAIVFVVMGKDEFR